MMNNVGIWLCAIMLYQNVLAQRILEDLSCDFNDKTLCTWQIRIGETQFEPIFNYTNFDDANKEDLVLIFRPTVPNTQDHHVIYSITSPSLLSGDYEFSFNINMNFVGNVQVIVKEDRTESQILKVPGNRNKIWDTYSVRLPKYHEMFIMLEVQFTEVADSSDYVAINFLKMIDKQTKENRCEFQCQSSDRCVANDKVCDTVTDCHQHEDEKASCDQLPPGSYCNFSENLCHWFNYDNSNSSGDWQHMSEGYLAVVFKGAHRFGSISYLTSPIFDEIPLYHSMSSSKYYKSCKVRFSYRFSSSSNDLALELEPVGEPRSPHPIQLWRHFNKRLGSGKWENVTIPMPLDVHSKYRLKFGAALGFHKSISNTFSRRNELVAIDHLSLSKECFAIDVPKSEPRNSIFTPVPNAGHFFAIPQAKSLKKYVFTPCGATGRKGPTYSQCESFYMNSSTRAAVFETVNFKVNGTQMWTVPKSAYYTIYAKGADGGRGLYKHPGGKGALVRAVFYLYEGDTIFLAIGQAGSSACSTSTKHFDQCSSPKQPAIAIGAGGGGATYVFKFKSDLIEMWTPLLIAGGGGGGSGKFNPDMKFQPHQHGQGFDIYNTGTEGSVNGSGGGWNYSSLVKNEQSGNSYIAGAYGGLTCKNYAKWMVNGGFGGGGGGCFAGGGGGGFHGGKANNPFEAGDGGTSFVDFSQTFLQLYRDLSMTSLSGDDEPEDGLVVIVPQIDQCCNEQQFSCVITGQTLNGTMLKHCICASDRFMPDFCVYVRPFYLTILWLVLCAFIISFLVFTCIVVQRKSVRRKFLQRNQTNNMHLLSNSSTEVQLSRLRSHNMITEYNPNYEFGGSTCTLQDLKDIPREKLNLVKALGQGAFGEVYQGFLHKMPDENSEELSVAVKTLPEYSANKQAEMDFLMEALIMSKFQHRNIVRFFGVCFEKMPRFIILELLPGGDLKTFLRENRGTIDNPSPLVMGDLLVMALDVASGCQYLEENHFIHRDIAARNCLLTAKVKANHEHNNLVTADLVNNGTFDITNYQNGFNNSGIVVKIADFGMARNIYRADYYRKGGKAMLPVKWMPPEAFLDGVFTSKTDVWSFGVLLWEVMSMGYMPYPGRGNQEVMQLVTAGGRLEPPNSATPPQVYAIMSQCWSATPEFRPSFSTIIERIGYCLQDPDVLNVSLPIFHRAASVEKDMTLMRPPPDSTDYLVPNLGSQTNSNYSMTTEKTELLSPDTCSTLSCINDEKLLDMDDQNISIIKPLWGGESYVPGQISFNLNNAEPNNLNTGIILNPSGINYQHPSVRYVNVNVNNDMFGSNQPFSNVQMNNSQSNTNC